MKGRKRLLVTALSTVLAMSEVGTAGMVVLAAPSDASIEGTEVEEMYNKTDSISEQLPEVLTADGYNFNSSTGTMTLSGTVSGSAIRNFGQKGSVLSIVAAQGTVLPGDCSSLFSGYSKCTQIDLSKADGSNVTNTSNMFNGCSALTTLDLSGFKTSSGSDEPVIYHNGDGSGSGSPIIYHNQDGDPYVFHNGEDWASMNDGTAGVNVLTNTNSMFAGCSALKTLTLGKKIKEVSSGMSLANGSFGWNRGDSSSERISGSDTYAVITNSSTNTYHKRAQILGTVTISGNAKYGANLTASVSNSNTSKFTYQWTRDGSAISGATKASYQPVKADIGKTLGCLVACQDVWVVGNITGKTSAKIAKADGPAAPTGLKAVAPSEKGKADGKITGVTTAMEYSTTSNFGSNVIACTSTSITGLKAGTYYVRVKATETTNAGKVATVTVADGAVVTTAISGTVSISGTTKYGQTLTAKVSDSNASKLKYQWKRGNNSISGATSSTYKLAKEDIGQIISCVVTDANGKLTGSLTGKTSNKVAKADGPAAPTGISGTAPSEKGKADGKITGVTTAMEYSTTSDFTSNVIACTSTSITGLKAGTYYIRVKATDTTNAGVASKVTIIEGTEVKVALSGNVVISGTTKYGQTLTAKVADSNASKFKYQWKRGNNSISGATSSTYKLVKEDIGQVISCVITDADKKFTDSITGKTNTKIAKADGPAAPTGLKAVTPSEKGKADGKITGVKTTMEYSTKSDFSSNVKTCGSTTITGLKAGTYYVRVKETDTTKAGKAATIKIAEGAVVTTAISGTVSISGTTKYGQTLTAKVSDSNGSKFKYQWKRGNNSISGATSSTYKLAKEDIGQIISCVVTDANGKLTGSLTGKTSNKVAKADGPAAPTGLKAVAPSEKGKADGKITGVKTTMEYSTKSDFSSNVKACGSTTITGLKAGTYYVRVKETDTTLSGKATKISVPAGKVKEDPTVPSRGDVTKVFKDVPADAWYVNAVQFVYDRSIMNGTSETTFSPNMILTRGQFVTVLYNMEGQPSAKYKKDTFKDVKEDAYYALPVMWAVKNDITSGIGDGLFGPDQNITREQLATMLYKYAIVKGYKTDINKKALNDFPDRKDVSDWAKEAMQWAVTNGVMSGKAGKNGNILDPKGQASRAECAQMIKNLLNP